MVCTGNTEAPGRERPLQGQKPLLKATDQARSRDRSKNEATQIPVSMRQRTLEISSDRSQWNLSAVKAGGQHSGSSHKCQSSAPALLPGKSFKSEQLPHPSTLENSQFPWAEVMKDAATVLICLRWKEREGKKATQCSAWRKRNTCSYFRASSWLGSKYSHDTAVF